MYGNRTRSVFCYYMVNWYPIDTAGKLFPSVSGQGNSSFFRVAVILKEPVNAAIYQRALEIVRPRFSFFFVRLRQGTFWNYLEENDEPFLVQKETDYPCSASSFGRCESHMVRFLYFGNRLSIEIFHSITDGSGAMEFLKAVLFAYSVIDAEGNGCTVLPAAEGRIVNIQSTPVIDDYENSFLRFTKLNKKGSRFEIRKFSPDSYHIAGTSLPGGNVSIVTGLVDSVQLNRYVRSLGTTVTGYLAALLIYTLYCTRLKFCTQRRPVAVSVPVNLRKQFPSSTFRNFFAVINVSYSFTDSADENLETLFPAIVRSVSLQIALLCKKENLQREIDRDIFFDKNNISRWVPLKIKHLFVKEGFNLFGETRKTISLSNMGVIDLPPATAALIDHAETLLYATPKSPLNCAFVTVNGILSISFTKSIEENDVLRSFFVLLQQQSNLSVSIYSNNTVPVKMQVPEKIKCPSCGLQIFTEYHYCPLCGKYLGPVNSQESSDPDEARRAAAFQYPLYQEKELNKVKTAFFFAACTVSIISLFINYFTFGAKHFLWSFIVISTVFFIYETVFIWTSSIHYTGSKLFSQFFWSSQLMLVLDFLTGFSFWSLSLVIPWFSISVTLVLTILAVCNRKNYQEYAGYITAAFFLSFIPFIISLFPFIKVKWPSWGAVLYAMLTVFGLFLFSRRQFRFELKKRFLL